VNTEHPYDVVVIGGGINGVGVAADAAGRGLSVLLCEQNDLASATSSASSKLIHGGLRYLEHYDFALVRSSLIERKILLKSAPHLVHPIRFAVPFNKLLRPFWIIRLGLFLYDLMGHSRTFKRSKAIYFNPTDPSNPLKRSIRKGFIYTDCIVDDARLVITNALRAKRRGAKIATRVKCIHAVRTQDFWEVTLENVITKQKCMIRARSLVNAAGPWVEDVNKNVLHVQSETHIRLVKGSHLIVPKLYDREQAYVLQHKDGRIVFVIPYLKQFSMIGTTDVEYDGAPLKAKIDLQEMEYLCDIVSDYFHHPLKSQQILSTWSGVRPLVDDKSSNLSAINRGFSLEFNVDGKNSLPLINIFGGKLTTYRLVSEKVVDMLAPYFIHCSNAWTSKFPLPGGDLPDGNFTLFLEKLAQDYDWLPSALLMRYAQTYGTLTYVMLKDIKDETQLGQDLGHGLYEIELKYLINNEWAKTAEDILLRRTKLGLFYTPSEQERLEVWIQKNNK
jgi:glycerol-3-phosphate dehydrogenase